MASWITTVYSFHVYLLLLLSCSDRTANCHISRSNVIDIDQASTELTHALQSKQNINDILASIWDWLNTPVPEFVNTLADWMGIAADIIAYYSVIDSEFFTDPDHEEIKELINEASRKQEEIQEEFNRMKSMMKKQKEPEKTTVPNKYFMRR